MNKQALVNSVLFCILLLAAFAMWQDVNRTYAEIKAELYNFENTIKIDSCESLDFCQTHYPFGIVYPVVFIKTDSTGMDKALYGTAFKEVKHYCRSHAVAVGRLSGVDTVCLDSSYLTPFDIQQY